MSEIYLQTFGNHLYRWFLGIISIAYKLSCHEFLPGLFLWNRLSQPEDYLHLVMRCVYAQSCPTLCDLMDCNLPGSSVHEISQARILEQVAISFSRGSSDPGIKPVSPVLAGRCFTAPPPGKPHLSISGWIILCCDDHHVHSRCLAASLASTPRCQ